MLYSHENGLLDIWEVIRDPEKVEADREAAKKGRPMAAMFANSMAIGQSMLMALETGEYVGRENREIEHDRTQAAKANERHQSGLEKLRSAESDRRLAEMADDVRTMEEHAEMNDGYDY